jgi:hypothetical protein
MYWFGLVAGWMVAATPASFAALATAVPILWNKEPGLEVAIPTVWPKADPAKTSPAASVSDALIPVYVSLAIGLASPI